MHSIRLRRPWIRKSTPSSLAETVDVPDLTGGFPHGVVYERRFNCPTGLSSDDHVELFVERASGAQVGIVLNGTEVFDGRPTQIVYPLRVDITSLLQPTNQLSVRLEGSAEANASLDGAVALEIVA